MAVREPAHPIEKRDLLHAEKPNTARMNEIASAMVAAGRSPEGVDYAEITRDPAIVAAMEADAVKRGSAWLLQQVERLRGAKCLPETWVRTAESARAAERWLDAVRSLQFAGRADEAEALRLERCPDFDPFKPLGK